MITNPQPLQESVQLVVTSQVLRAGSYKGGYQIINQSLVATVWASSNPGMSSGYGTPVSPGTSLIWSSDDDLYLILGNDSQSVTAASAAITLSYQTQLWQPNPAAVAVAALNTGNVIVDNPVLLVNLVASSANSGIIDISRYQSLILYCNYISGGSALYSIQFFADNLGVSQVAEYDIHFSTIVSDTIYMELPLTGNFMKIFVNGTYTHRVYGSYRRVDKPTQGYWRPLNSTTALPNATVSSVLHIPPYFGKYEISWTVLRSDAVDPVSNFTLWSSLAVDSIAQQVPAIMTNPTILSGDNSRRATGYISSWGYSQDIYIYVFGLPGAVTATGYVRVIPQTY